MSPPSVEPVEGSAAEEAATPGLPWFRTWRGVYLFVFGCFVLSVALLALLAWAFS